MLTSTPIKLAAHAKGVTMQMTIQRLSSTLPNETEKRQRKVITPTDNRFELLAINFLMKIVPQNDLLRVENCLSFLHHYCFVSLHEIFAFIFPLIHFQIFFLNLYRCLPLPCLGGLVDC